MYLKGKANEIANMLLERFKAGEVAEPLAQVFIKMGSLPMHGWSPTNQLLALLYGATDARSFTVWKSAGRSVKGQSALGYILQPMSKKVEPDEGDPYYYVYGYRPLAIWDVSQTSGDPLPEYEDTGAQDFIDNLPLLDVAKEFGLEVVPFDGKNKGYLGFFSNSQGKIGLGVENLSTWFHELIHAADKKLGNLKETGQHWRSETVAEFGGSVLAIMLGYEVEADTGGAWQYIQNYANAAGIEPVDAVVDVIKRTGQAIELILETAQQD